jgi:integrase
MFLVKAKREKQENGKTHHYWSIREKGKKELAIGWMTQEEAERVLEIANAKALLQENGLLPQKTSRKSSEETLAEYLVRRVIPHQEAQGRSAKTILSVRASQKHLERLLGDRPIARITSADGDNYVAIRRKEGARGRTIQIERGPLMLALKLAKKDGIIDSIPEIAWPEADDSREHVFLTTAQCLQLIEALPWQNEPASALAIYASLELGWRSGECLSRRWEDIRWDQGDTGAIYIGFRLNIDREPTWKTKKKKARTVSMTAGLRLALQEWWLRQGRPAEGWIFPSPYDASNHLGSYKKGLKAACARAGVPILHPHALRHSWATRAAIAGVPKMITMAIGGWTDPRTLEKVYQHSVSEEEISAVHRVSLDVSVDSVCRQRKKAGSVQ